MSSFRRPTQMPRGRFSHRLSAGSSRGLRIISLSTALVWKVASIAQNRSAVWTAAGRCWCFTASISRPAKDLCPSMAPPSGNPVFPSRAGRDFTSLSRPAMNSPSGATFSSLRSTVWPMIVWLGRQTCHNRASRTSSDLKPKDPTCHFFQTPCVRSV